MAWRVDVTVRLEKNPESVRTLLADYTAIVDAARAVSAVIASGIVPAAMEMMDGPTIRAVEASIYAAGYPVDADAVLLIELDGLAAGLEEDVALVERLCREAGARSVRVARDEAERARLWQGRKKAFGAMGRISPDLVVQDAVVPRTRLPDVLAEIHRIAQETGVLVCNVFHAGDGNLHPNIAYDARDAEATVRVHHAMRAIMRTCIAAGGTITGEHGVGTRQARLHAARVHRRHARRDVPVARRVRPGAARESGQGRAGAIVPRVANGAETSGNMNFLELPNYANNGTNYPNPLRAPTFLLYRNKDNSLSRARRVSRARSRFG